MDNETANLITSTVTGIVAGAASAWATVKGKISIMENRLNNKREKLSALDKRLQMDEREYMKIEDHTHICAANTAELRIALIESNKQLGEMITAKLANVYIVLDTIKADLAKIKQNGSSR
jgi:hypothetical protein